METETQTEGVALEFRPQDAGWFRVSVPDGRGPVWLLESELRALVQAAYDRYGILAAPSFQGEGVAR